MLVTFPNYFRYLLSTNSKVPWWQQWLSLTDHQTDIVSFRMKLLFVIIAIGQNAFCDISWYTLFDRASPETELVIVQRVGILFAETRDRQQNGITNFENRIWTSLCSTRLTTNFPLKILIRNRTDQRGPCQL